MIRRLLKAIRDLRRYPVLDDPADGLTVYRCTECGHVSLSLGGLHGHIESHRPIWRFWQLGDPAFLSARTEVIAFEPVCREIRGGEGVAAE